MSRLAFVSAWALLAAISLSAQTVVFTEDFESYSVPGSGIPFVSPATFGLWTVTAGSVDVLRNYPGIPCRTGAQCMDDGSTGVSGAVQRTFTATAGTPYTLTFWYSGSQRAGSATDSMTVALGSATLVLNNIPFSQGYTQGTLNWTAPSSGSFLVQFFYSTGADNSGLMVDDITLTAGGLPGVPLPPTITLTILGLACLGGYSAWRMHRSRAAIG